MTNFRHKLVERYAGPAFFALLAFSPALIPTEWLGRFAWAALVPSIAILVFFIWLFYAEVKEEAEASYPPGLNHAASLAFQLTEAALFFSVVVCSALSGILFSLAQQGSRYVPFGSDLTRTDAVLFVVDQALKGGLLDFMEVFDLNLNDSLKFRARDFMSFSIAIFIFRTFVIAAFLGLVKKFWDNRKKNKDKWRLIDINGQKSWIDLSHPFLMRDLLSDEKVKAHVIQYHGSRGGEPRSVPKNP